MENSDSTFSTKGIMGEMEDVFSGCLYNVTLGQNSKEIKITRVIVTLKKILTQYGKACRKENSMLGVLFYSAIGIFEFEVSVAFSGEGNEKIMGFKVKAN